MSLNNFCVSSLNCYNLKANLAYCIYLVETSNIIFFSELWTKKNEFHLIQKLTSKKCHRNSPIYQSDIPNSSFKGRPFGGLCWILDDYCDVIESTFFNRYLSFIHVRIKDQEMLFFGVYMPFFNRKNKKESIFQ